MTWREWGRAVLAATGWIVLAGLAFTALVGAAAYLHT